MHLKSLKTVSISILFSLLVIGCSSSTRKYTQMPEDWQLFCTPEDTRCYGEEATTMPQYEYVSRFPVYSGSFSLESFGAEGRGRIMHIVDATTFWLLPDGHKRSRLHGLVKHHQNYLEPGSAFKDAILVKLLDAKALLPATQDTSWRLSRSLMDIYNQELVDYRCYGMNQSGVANCFLRLRHEYDMGEWMIARGLAKPEETKKVDVRYTKAFSFAKKQKVGLHAGQGNVEMALFPIVKKDIYGYCRQVADPHDIQLKNYAFYHNMEDCLKSGGLRPKYY